MTEPTRFEEGLVAGARAANSASGEPPLPGKILAGIEDEAALAARTVQLEANVRELEAFSAAVSHDLRGSASSIRRRAEMLLADPAASIDDAVRGHIGQMGRSASGIVDVVDGLLNLSRAGQQALKRSAVDISWMAGEVWEQLLERELGRQVPLHVAAGMQDFADPVLTRILLRNLLDNAFKFTRGREPAEVEVGFVLGEDAAAPTYFVRDNGAGFDVALSDKLFQPFQRLHAASEYQGSGIGLATVRRIVGRHGGRVWAESTPGRGAIFFFTLARPNRRD